MNPFVQHLSHVFGDRHLDSYASSETEDAFRRLDPLGNHFHLGNDLIEVLPLGKTYPHAVIPASSGATGRDQVTHTGKAGKGCRLPTQGHTEACQLGERSCDQSGAGIVAEPQAIRHPGGDCHHILESASQLDRKSVV